jgi:hypothetical protein
VSFIAFSCAASSYFKTGFSVVLMFYVLILFSICIATQCFHRPSSCLELQREQQRKTSGGVCAVCAGFGRALHWGVVVWTVSLHLWRI